MIGAPLMTLTTGRVPRRTLLIGLAAIFHARQPAVGSGRQLRHAAVRRGSLPRSTTAPSSASARSSRRALCRRSAGAPGRSLRCSWASPSPMWLACRSRPGRASISAGARRFWGIAGLGVVTMAALRPDAAAHARRPPVATCPWRSFACWCAARCSAALGLTVRAARARCSPCSPISRRSCVSVTHASLGFVTAMLVTYGVGLTVGNWLRRQVRRPVGGPHADRYAGLAVVRSWSRSRADAVRRGLSRDPGVPLGRGELRAGAAAAGAVMAAAAATPNPRVLRQYRRVQSRQCARRGAEAAR